MIMFFKIVSLSFILLIPWQTFCKFVSYLIGSLLMTWLYFSKLSFFFFQLLVTWQNFFLDKTAILVNFDLVYKSHIFVWKFCSHYSSWRGCVANYFAHFNLGLGVGPDPTCIKSMLWSVDLHCPEQCPFIIPSLIYSLQALYSMEYLPIGLLHSKSYWIMTFNLHSPRDLYFFLESSVL